MGPCGDDSIYGDKALQNKIGDVWFGTFATACLARLDKRKCACFSCRITLGPAQANFGLLNRLSAGGKASLARQSKVSASDKIWGISCMAACINKHNTSSDVIRRVASSQEH